MRILTCTLCVLHLTYLVAAAEQGQHRTVETEVVGAVNGNQWTLADARPLDHRLFDQHFLRDVERQTDLLAAAYTLNKSSNSTTT
jgi:hypothetical protein